MRPTVAVTSVLLFAAVVTSQPPPFHGYSQKYAEPHFAPVMHPYYPQPRPLAPHHQHFHHHPQYSHSPTGPTGHSPQFSQFVGQDSPSKLFQYHQYPVTFSNTYYQPFGQMPQVQSFHPFYNNYQSYLFDPYMNHPAPPRIRKGPSPPFGFIEKQVRNPNADPADIVRIAPPKAIMTTSVEVLGLGQGSTEAESPHHQENENYGDTYPRRRVSQDMKKQWWGSRDLSERKSMTPFFNKQDKSSNRKSKISSKLKSFSSSSGVEVAADDEPNHISEPILSNDALSLFSSLKSHESNQVAEQGQQEQNPHNPDDDFDRDHSSAAAAASENAQIEKPEPIALFETEAGSPVQDAFIDEMEEAVLNSLSNSVNSEEDEGKRRIYHCPNARDLNELAGADVFPDPVRCDQFYYCKWGKAFVFQCPINHFFNPYLKVCDDDSDFACSMSLKK